MADPPPLIQTLRLIVRRLDEIDARYAIVGGLALMAWLPPRATTDIDAAVEVGEQDVADLARLLARKLDGAASARPIRFRSGAMVQRVLLHRPEGEVILDLMPAAEGYLAQVVATGSRGLTEPVSGSVDPARRCGHQQEKQEHLAPAGRSTGARWWRRWRPTARCRRSSTGRKGW